MTMRWLAFRRLPSSIERHWPTELRNLRWAHRHKGRAHGHFFPASGTPRARINPAMIGNEQKTPAIAFLADVDRFLSRTKC